MSYKSKSSFCTFVKSTKLIRVQPPGCHSICRVTGGLATLYKQLKHQESHHEHTSCTDENGVFNPGLLQKVPLLAKRYKYIKMIGTGISSVTIQAIDTYRRDNYEVAIKILHTEFTMLGYQEADTVLRLNRVDPSNFSRVIKLLNTCMFDGHFCMVYELLCPSPLHKVISPCLCKDEKLKLIRKISVQLLQVLGFLSQTDVIHADLKPENILCCTDDISEGIKVVDFGNAIHCIFNELALYYDDFQLQTVLYRAPEVAFGLPFGPEIDMWSVGCILAELYIGEPLFPAKNNEFLLTRMVGLLGPLPCSPFNRGKFHGELKGFIGKTQPPHVTVNKIRHYLKGSPDFNFVTFLFGMLKYNPDERMSVSEAFQHAFIAPEVAGRFLLPGLNKSSSYSTLDLDSSLYTKSPEVSADITKECLLGVDLLRRGTFRRAVAEVSPFVKKRSPSIKVCPQATAERGRGDTHVISGTAARLSNPRNHQEFRVDSDSHSSLVSGSFGRRVDQDALGSQVNIDIPNSDANHPEVNNDDPNSQANSDILNSEVSSGGASSEVNNDDPNSQANSDIFNSEVSSGGASSEVNNEETTAFIADKYKDESFNEVAINVSNEKCNNERRKKTEEDKIKRYLNIDENVNQLQGLQQTSDLQKGINNKRRSPAHASYPSISRHLPHKQSGEVMDRQTINSKNDTQYFKHSLKDRSKRAKVESVVTESSSGVNKFPETTKRFEHFHRSRQIMLRRCADGFKELADEEDDNINGNDPYDLDSAFNSVKSPVKSLHRTKSKSNVLRIKKSKNSPHEKKLELELNDEKNDIKKLFHHKTTKPTTSDSNSMLKTKNIELEDMKNVIPKKVFCRKVAPTTTTNNTFQKARGKKRMKMELEGEKKVSAPSSDTMNTNSTLTTRSEKSLSVESKNKKNKIPKKLDSQNIMEYLPTGNRTRRNRTMELKDEKDKFPIKLLHQELRMPLTKTNHMTKGSKVGPDDEANDLPNISAVTLTKMKDKIPKPESENKQRNKLQIEITNIKRSKVSVHKSSPDFVQKRTFKRIRENKVNASESVVHHHNRNVPHDLIERVKDVIDFRNKIAGEECDMDTSLNRLPSKVSGGSIAQDTIEQCDDDKYITYFQIESEGEDIELLSDEEEDEVLLL